MKAVVVLLLVSIVFGAAVFVMVWLGIRNDKARRAGAMGRHGPVRRVENRARDGSGGESLVLLGASTPGGGGVKAGGKNTGHDDRQDGRADEKSDADGAGDSGGDSGGDGGGGGGGGD